MSSADRACFTVFVAILVGGIVCFVYGGIFLTTSNGFTANKNAYQSNIAWFENSNQQRMLASTGLLDGVTPLFPTSIMVNNYGPNAALLPQNVESVALNASLVEWRVNHTVTVVYPGADAAVIPIEAQQNQSIGVVRVQCNSRNGCDAGTMREKCQAASCPVGMLFSGPGKASSNEWKNCFFMTTTPYVCKVVDAAAGGAWNPSSELHSCDWPFLQQRRVCGYDRPAIPYLVRASNDPYVVLSKLTRGSFDFGLTETQQIVYGSLLIAGGVLCFLSLFGVCLCVLGCPCKPSRTVYSSRKKFSFDDPLTRDEEKVSCIKGDETSVVGNGASNESENVAPLDPQAFNWGDKPSVAG